MAVVVLDVDWIAVLTDNDYQRARNYWKVLKNRPIKEGNETVTNYNQFKLTSNDGKSVISPVKANDYILPAIDKEEYIKEIDD